MATRSFFILIVSLSFPLVLMAGETTYIWKKVPDEHRCQYSDSQNPGTAITTDTPTDLHQVFHFQRKDRPQEIIGMVSNHEALLNLLKLKSKNMKLATRAQNQSTPLQVTLTATLMSPDDSQRFSSFMAANGATMGRGFCGGQFNAQQGAGMMPGCIGPTPMGGFGMPTLEEPRFGPSPYMAEGFGGPVPHADPHAHANSSANIADTNSTTNQSPTSSYEKPHIELREGARIRPYGEGTPEITETAPYVEMRSGAILQPRGSEQNQITLAARFAEGVGLKQFIVYKAQLNEFGQVMRIEYRDGHQSLKVVHFANGYPTEQDAVVAKILSVKPKIDQFVTYCKNNENRKRDLKSVGPPTSLPRPTPSQQGAGQRVNKGPGAQ